MKNVKAVKLMVRITASDDAILQRLQVTYGDENVSQAVRRLIRSAGPDRQELDVYRKRFGNVSEGRDES